MQSSEDLSHGQTEHCWACKTKLNEAGQKVCQNCHRWQTWPWRHLNLSNAALAVVAAVVGTGLAVSAAVNSYKDERSVSAYVVGQSLQVISRNLNFRIFVHGRSVLALLDDASCYLPQTPDVIHRFTPVEKHSVFLPLQTEIISGFMQASKDVPATFKAAKSITCIMTFTNENGHDRSFTVEFRVSN
jgi:hypothetical protein